MARSIDHHKSNCPCPACKGRHQGGSKKFLVSVDPALASWIREQGGCAFLRQLAEEAYVVLQSEKVRETSDYE